MGAGSAAHRRFVRTRMVAVALLVVSTVAAVLLAGHFHLGPETVLIPVLGGLPALYLAYVTYRDAQEDADRALSLSQVADQLAEAVRRQWLAEAKARRLDDPYPLPVRWRAADSSLVDEWATLKAMAASGAGWPAHSKAWAADPAELAGGGADLVSVLERIPTGRLVVLGEPGSGKTVLLVRLVLDLLARRESGGLVPVLVSVASWDPVTQELRGWLANQLCIGYPGLAATISSGENNASRADALLGAGLVMPILDGLDEIPTAVRGPAIARINDAVLPGEHLVVASRTDQYRDAARPPSGVEVTLRGAAGIQLFALSAADVGEYLRVDAGGPAGAARWSPVLAAFTTQPPPPVVAVLTNPLMVALARVIYNARPGERRPAGWMLPDPAELCSFPSLIAVEHHLLDAFIPAAFLAAGSGRPRRRPWSTDQAEDWLAFLARSLDLEQASELAWWRLVKTVSHENLVSIIGPGFAIATWLGTWAGVGLWTAGRNSALAALLVGLGVATIFAVGGWLLGMYAAVFAFLGNVQPARGARLRRSKGALGGLVAGLILGPIWSVATLTHGGTVISAVFTMVGTVVGFTALSGLGGSLRAAPSDLSTAATPQSVLRRDRRSAIILMLVFGAGVGLPVGLVLAAREGLVGGSVLALVIGLIVGPVASSAKTAWPRWLVARTWLALHHRLPWRYMSFLADARERGVLRQVGTIHQFRHIELQHRLAQRPSH